MYPSDMKAVILAGGLGTRLREETEYRPKPMVEIGGKPILWHIMKNLGHQDVSDFVIALGYKGDKIKDFFLNYQFKSSDFTVNLGNSDLKFHSTNVAENWNVTLADTGPLTMTGGRILMLEKFLKDEPFFLCTYGDGLANINLNHLINFHKSHGKIATVSASVPGSRFGRLGIEVNGKVSSFKEKPVEQNYVNAGFFIFSPEIFRYLTPDSVLERQPLETLAREGELFAYKHDGFWQPMDTIREVESLNEIWSHGNAPWKNWD